MRTSRTSRGAAKIAALLPRRTRSSQLAAANGAGGDIEDAAGATPSKGVRKRKLSTGTASLASPRSSTRAAKRTPSKVKAEDSDSGDADGRVTETTTTEAAVTAPRRKPRAAPARATRTEAGAAAIHAPADWEAQYAACAAMRARIEAPVDTMGCERLFDAGAPPHVQRFQTLVSLMLSSQTKDAVTAAAIGRLQNELPAPPGFTAEGVRDAPAALVNELIGKVGFHNNKTRYIQAAAECAAHHGGDIPPGGAQPLMELAGVGPKMAYLCAAACWPGEAEGIGVDVHVHRITNLWGWHRTKNPEETRIALQAWLPRSKWHEINTLLVGLGQTVCAPVGRRCGECDLGLQGLCPGAVGAELRKVTKRTTVKAKAEGANGAKEEETTRIKSEVDVEITARDVPAV